MEKLREKSKFWKKSTLFEKNGNKSENYKKKIFLTTLIRKSMKFWTTLVILACIGQISINFFLRNHVFFRVLSLFSIKRLT